MKLINLQALRGPNIHQLKPGKLINLRLDLSYYNIVSLHQLKEIELILSKDFPEYSNYISKVQWEFQLESESIIMDKLAELVSVLAAMLQQEKHQGTLFIKILKTMNYGIYACFFSYNDEEVGKYAAKSSVELMSKLLAKQPVEVVNYITALNEYKKHQISIVDEAIFRTAELENIPCINLYNKEWIQFGYGVHQKRMVYNNSEWTDQCIPYLNSNLHAIHELLYESSIEFINNPLSNDQYGNLFCIDIEQYKIVQLNCFQFGVQMDLQTSIIQENEFMIFRLCKLINLEEGVLYMVGEEMGLKFLKVEYKLSEFKNESIIKKPIEFFKSKNFKIPIIAVSGTNGKTTTTRLISHIIQHLGIKTGFTTSDGVYIDGHIVEKGDTTGPSSALNVLRDPNVEYAILETARGGILRAGIAFQECDVAVLTNVTSDHLGLSDIHHLDDLARVKGLIVELVSKNGYAVLNADNLYTYEIEQKAKCNVAYFSIQDKSNQCIAEHMRQSGTTAYVESYIAKIFHQGEILDVMDIREIPISYSGKVSFNVSNALAAILACHVQGFSIEQIRKGVKSFFPSAEQTPGRLNVFEFKDFKVLVDFAHNPEGFRGVKEFLQSFPCTQKIGIITGTGDRPDASTIELGEISAAMFDHIIIHQAKFHRGKKKEEILHLLVTGLKNYNSEVSFEILDDEVEPLAYAMSKVIEGGLITALSAVLNDPIALIRKYQNQK